MSDPITSAEPTDLRERVRVRVEDMRPGDLLVGSSRTVIAAPGRDSTTRRRHVQLVVENAAGERNFLTWRAATLVYVLRELPVPPPRADLDG